MCHLSNRVLEGLKVSMAQVPKAQNNPEGQVLMALSFLHVTGQNQAGYRGIRSASAAT